MKALQKFNPDTNTWENVFSRPLSDLEAITELDRQMQWAENDEVTAEFRLVDFDVSAQEREIHLTDGTVVERAQSSVAPSQGSGIGDWTPHQYVIDAGWDFTCIEATAERGLSSADEDVLTEYQQRTLLAYCQSRVAATGTSQS